MIPVIDKRLVEHFYPSFRILFAGELTQRETFGEVRFWDRFRERSRHSAKIAIDLKTATCQHRNAIAILSASVGSQLHAPAPHRRHRAHLGERETTANRQLLPLVQKSTTEQNRLIFPPHLPKGGYRVLHLGTVR